MTAPLYHGKWWGPEIRKGDRWETLMAYVRQLRLSQQSRHERNLRHALLYDPYGGLDGITEAPWQADLRVQPLADIVIENIIAKIINTLASLVGKNRPRAAVMARRADWSLQRDARKLERVLEAEWDRTSLYKMGRLVHRDSCALGTGVGKLTLFNSSGDPKNPVWVVTPERRLIDDITVDEAEWRLSDGRCIYEVSFYDKDYYKALHPKFASYIDQAPAAYDRWATMRYLGRNMIAIVEGWHLPTFPDAPEEETDGRHVMCVDGVDIVDEPYHRTKFPHMFLHNNERVTGFYGQGVAERQATRQLRLNKVNQIIILSQDRFAFPHVFLHYLDAQNKAKLIPMLGRILLFQQIPPKIETPTAVSAELYQYRQDLKREAASEEGLSEFQMKDAQPPYESGRALREAWDQDSVRHSPSAQRVEEWYMGMADLWVDYLVRASEDAPIRASWKNRGLLETVEWKGLKKAGGTKYGIRLVASSLMNQTPAAQQDEVQFLLGQKLISPETAGEYFYHPDPEGMYHFQNSDNEDALSTVDDVFDGDVSFPAPLPEQRLDLVTETMRQAYNQARHAGCPEALLQRAEIWMDNAVQVMTQRKLRYQEIQSLAQPPQPPPPPGMVPGAPGAPPPPGAAAPGVQVARPQMGVAGGNGQPQGAQ